jgi:LacI family transcriptional regulator
MQSMEHQTRKSGANMSLYLVNLEIETERDNLRKVVERGVDGVLVYYIGGMANQDALQTIVDAKIPLLLFDRYLEDLPVDSVCTDNRLGAYRATLRFLDAGQPTVAYVTGPIDSTALRDRLLGYREAMAEQGLKPNVMELKQELGDAVDRTNYDLTRRIVSRIKFPTAILSADATRLAIISQLIEGMGIAPASYALGCFDEPYLNLPDELMLVRVLQPLREIGRKAVELLMSRIDGLEEPPRRLLLAPEILTTGNPADILASS